MTPDINRTARIAGLLYLLLLPTCGIVLGGGQLLEPSAVNATLEDLRAARGFLEFRVLAGGAGFVIWLLVAVALHKLFSSVSKTAANILVVFVVASVCLALAALARQMDVISLMDSRLSDDELQPALTAALHGFRNLMLGSILFWGLWLLPFGWLAYRSGFVPRALGVLLLIGAPFYVMIFAGTVIDPAYSQSRVGQIVGVIFGIPGVVGELGTALWLLIRGVKPR